MKNYFRIKEDKDGTKHFYNKNNKLHRLNGPAVDYKNGDRIYFINYNRYMLYIKNNNKLLYSPRNIGINFRI